MILAWLIRAICLIARLLPQSALRISSKRFVRRSFISPAADFVKVTITILSISTGFRSSKTRLTILSTRTAVLPDPAAALTRRLQFLSYIAVCCSLVQLLIFLILQSDFCEKIIQTYLFPYAVFFFFNNIKSADIAVFAKITCSLVRIY